MFTLIVLIFTFGATDANPSFYTFQVPFETREACEAGGKAIVDKADKAIVRDVDGKGETPLVDASFVCTAKR